MGLACYNLGELSEKRGAPDRGMRYWVAAERLFEDTGHPYRAYTTAEIDRIQSEQPTDLIPLRQTAANAELEELVAWVTASPT